MSSFVFDSHLTEVQLPVDSVQICFFCSFVFITDAEIVPVHHHNHHAWTFPDFLWRCSPKPDRQKKGSPAKSLYCRHRLFPFPSAPLRFLRPSLNRGSVPEKLWRSSSKSAIPPKPSHPSRSSFRCGPPPF
ncbi:hypothetical protein XENORESO_002355 [Xenotaenia resolanae]|uniref:C2H2-type domain-containing protein n=1 Tax=Xenotaenia resolanae TaxID=208358 RepID=A0ABV0VNF7_9TELE